MVNGYGKLDYSSVDEMNGYSMQLSKTKCLFSNRVPNTYMYLENLLTWEVLSYFQKTPYLIEIHANLLKGVGGI